jgi:hypothetical protein
MQQHNLLTHNIKQAVFCKGNSLFVYYPTDALQCA